MPTIKDPVDMLVRMLRIGKNKFRNTIKIFQRINGTDQQNEYSNYRILLPFGHRLPINQRLHIQYDRFLPHLAKHLNSLDIVVDVGANVGDTVASMLDANSELEFICIEPDDQFFSYLIKNIATIQKIFPRCKIKALQRLIGKNINNVKLAGAVGTRHSVEIEEDGIQSIRLDEILANCPPPRLIKCDVDGFDWDVLESAERALITGSSIVFFECEYTQLSQEPKFKNIIHTMKTWGYCHWWIFDNFGNFLFKTDNINQIISLINYVWRQNFKGATRTIWYFDLLASKNIDEQFLDNVVKTYCHETDRRL